MPSFHFEEAPLYAYGLIGILVFGVCAFFALLFITAPYGRHYRKGFGPAMPARLGWIVMEAPSPIGSALVFLALPGPSRTLGAWVLFFLWQLHYVYRSFVFPFRMRGAKQKPVLTVALAFLFNCVNGAANAYGIRFLAPDLESLGALFSIGVALWFLGWAMNHHADAILFSLRKPGETGYKIPRGGMYRFISSPNYFGEMLEWLGFAIAAQTAAGWTFAFFTFANLAPRARDNHRWYLEKFEDYPKERKALVPFVY